MFIHLQSGPFLYMEMDCVQRQIQSDIATDFDSGDRGLTCSGSCSSSRGVRFVRHFGAEVLETRSFQKDTEWTSSHIHVVVAVAVGIVDVGCCSYYCCYCSYCFILLLFVLIILFILFVVLLIMFYYSSSGQASLQRLLHRTLSCNVMPFKCNEG